jgi:hypothetical protein
VAVKSRWGRIRGLWPMPTLLANLTISITDDEREHINNAVDPRILLYWDDIQ